MKNILVTGGAGFIGSNAIDYLLSKYPHYTIVNVDKLSYAASIDNMHSFYDNPRHIFIKGDITDQNLIEKIFVKYDITGVIHFAAESHVDNSIKYPDIFVQTNIVGTFILLEAARKLWKGNNRTNRFHHISTDEVYGSLGDEGYFTEHTPYAPNSPYSASKASSDHLVRSYFKTYNLNTVISNCSNNYGPHQHQEKLIPTIIKKCITQEPIPIYGNGRNIRDWLFVQDHCHAIDVIFHQANPGEQFNIGGDNEIANIELAKRICQELNSLFPSENDVDYLSLIAYVPDRAGHDFRYAISFEKLRQAHNWSPQTDFAKGISQTLNFYLQRYRQIVNS